MKSIIVFAFKVFYGKPRVKTIKIAQRNLFVLKLPHFFIHCTGEWKSVLISKPTNFFRQSSHSYIVITLDSYMFAWFLTFFCDLQFETISYLELYSIFHFNLTWKFEILFPIETLNIRRMELENWTKVKPLSITTKNVASLVCKPTT